MNPKLKIRDVKAYLLYTALEKPLEFSFGAKTNRTTVLIEVLTDQGLSGWGEANWGGTIEGGRAMLSLVEERVRPAVIGRSPFEAEAIWRSMDGLSFDGNRVVATGGVDMALWDLQGQALGMPICDLLGGAYRDKVAMYASCLMINPLPELIQEAEMLAEQGWQGVKMRIGRDPSEDAERVRRVREAIGSKVKLMVDANGHFNRAEALRVGRAIEGYGIEHYEEPLPKYDIEGSAQLARTVGIPIAAGECTNLFNMKELLSREACQVILPDVGINGFTETRKILALAEAFRVEAVMHNFETAIGLAGTIQVAAACPILKQLQEVNQNPNPFREDLLEEPLRHEKGVFDVPKAPGLGVKVNRAIVKRYLVGQTKD